VPQFTRDIAGGFQVPSRIDGAFSFGQQNRSLDVRAHRVGTDELLADETLNLPVSQELALNRKTIEPP
jgi:hypothetical protein